jgi:hypothetical protein
VVGDETRPAGSPPSAGITTSSIRRRRRSDIELMTSSFDHVTPFGRGGPNTVENLAACCMTCQRVKFTKMPEELAEYRALKRICRAADCNVRFQPRYADYVRGFGFYHSRSCAAKAASH